MEVKKYHQLCIKEITGSISISEKQALESWLNKSDENRLEYEKIKTIWEKSLPGEIIQMPDIEMEWETLNNKIQLLKTDKKESLIQKVSSFIQSFRIDALKPAIGLGFAVILLIAGIYFYNLQSPVIQFRIVSTGNMEQKTIKLSDGSTIYLNTSSKVKFPEKFNKEVREVYLKGEAFFSVSKNKAAFIVKTDNAKTRVLGTKFNVKARDEKTEVFVKEGRVNLSQNIISAKGVDLTRGQFSRIIKKSIPSKPKEVNVDYLSEWMQGRLVFDQTPLNEIVVELERYYNVKLSIDNKEIEKQTLTGSFKNHSIDSVLSVICLTMNLNYEKNKEGYVIRSKKYSF